MGGKQLHPGRSRVQIALILLMMASLFVLYSGCVFLDLSNPPETLTNKTWYLKSYRSSDGSQQLVIPDTSITLVVSRDGRFNGSAGCNSYSGAYTVEGELINWGPVTCTAMYCPEPDGIMEQESEYIRLLENTTRFSASDEFLVLSHYDVEKMLIFTRKK